MSLAPGTRLGVYDITAQIGEGGMGQVWRARDTKLNRDVALKVLPDAFANDPDRLARFTREAQTLAALNHPHIAHIHGLEESGGVRALVMELVEGEDLSALIARGPLSFSDALPIAQQIADALEAAHEQGIIHRDLKPANVKVRADGTVKVLDFGLAKALDPAAASSAEAMNSPTLTGRATQMGVILGTAAYMAPEQARGRVVDRRADIWAFGVVMYEMLSGRRAFDGEDISITLASVLKDEVKWEALPKDLPVPLHKLLRRCLEKDPKRRLSWIGEARLALEDPAALQPASVSSATVAAAVTTAPLWRRALPWWLAGVLGAGLVAMLVLWVFRPAPAADLEPVRFEIHAPPKTKFDGYVAISPDGQHVVFSAGDSSGVAHLWIRDLKATEPRELPGTAGAASAFWSPNSRHIAFGFETQLKKIDIAGGPPLTLCQVATPVGSGAWSDEGVILFGGKGTGGLNRVAESGGTATLLTAREGGFSSFPSFLPDGRHFIYFRSGPARGIFLGSVDATPEAQPDKRLLESAFGAVFERTSERPGGRVLFIRDDTLLVQPFDVASLSLIGEAVPFTDRVTTVNQYPGVSTSRNGTLAFRYGTRAGGRVLTWLDREGKPLGTVGDPGNHNQLALSPDNLRLAYRDDRPAADGDLWTMDLARGVASRLTFDHKSSASPVWSPDGRRLAFAAEMDIVQKLASGEGEAEPLFKSAGRKAPTDWSKDGRFLFFTAIASPATGNDVHVLRLADHQAFPLIATRSAEFAARLSSDGRWLAYTSNESGRSEIFVRLFTAPAEGAPSVSGKWQVSTGGADQPMWRVDGKELIFRDQISGAPFVVDVTTTTTTFVSGTPRRLFTTIPQSMTSTSDAKRFLIGLPPQQEAEAPITVVLHWASALNRTPR